MADRPRLSATRIEVGGSAQCMCRAIISAPYALRHRPAYVLVSPRLPPRSAEPPSRMRNGRPRAVRWAARGLRFEVTALTSCAVRRAARLSRSLGLQTPASGVVEVHVAELVLGQVPVSPNHLVVELPG